MDVDKINHHQERESKRVTERAGLRRLEGRHSMYISNKQRDSKPTY